MEADNILITGRNRAKEDFVIIFLVFNLGLFFAILQFSYFFMLEAFVTSRVVSFFIALFFWLVGFLTGLNLKKRKSIINLLLLSFISYYFALEINYIFPFKNFVLPVIGCCILVSGITPGFFFKFFKKRFSNIKNLFFYENNGFITGVLISLLGTVFAGKIILNYGPALGIIPCLFSYIFFKKNYLSG